MAEIVVLVTASSEEETVRIAGTLVESGLAACANILPEIRSIFRWEGKIANERESLLVLKSQSECFEALSCKIKELHSYSLPEIIALPITQGSPDYLAWIREVTRTGKTKE